MVPGLAVVRALLCFGVTLSAVLSAAQAHAEDDPWLRRCSVVDPALTRAAHVVAERRAAGAPIPHADELGLLARDEGSRHPAPHALVLSGGELDGDEALARIERFLGTVQGERACGIARDVPGERVVLAARRLLELEGVPASVRVGSWITVKGTLLVDATHAKVVVLGPRGLPVSVPTSLHDGRVLARFRADRPGRFVAQVLAELEGGPKPVGELVVAAGTGTASVDDAGPKDEPDAARLLAFVRAREGLTELRRDEALDRLAAAHAEAMAKARRIAHDVGDGDPAERVARSLEVSLVGENVAVARDEATAHRLFWNSPSHRGNLLGERFDRFGLGRARGADGQVYVALLFVRS